MLAVFAGIAIHASANDVWGNDPSHNMVIEAKGLPDKLDESALLWRMEHGAKYGYPMPTVIGKRVYFGTGRGGIIDPGFAQLPLLDAGKKKKDEIGTLDKRCGTLTCLDLASGKGIWQVVLPCTTYDLSYGVCTTPVVEDNRFYILGQDEIVCLDLNGLEDGNQGMNAEDELKFQTSFHGKQVVATDADTKLPPTSADILWTHGLWQYDCWFEDATSCSPLIIGDQLWISTSSKNGTEQRQAKSKDAPKILVLDKMTGKLIARDRLPVPYVFHGEWSSPSLVEVDGQKIVVFPDGYGQMHGLGMVEPAEDGAVVDIPTLWTIDLNLKQYRYTPDGKEICYTEDKRLFRRYPKSYPDDSTRWEGLRDRKEHRLTGPCEVIGMPVTIGNRIYVALGRDCYYTNTREGKGRLMCWEVTNPTQAPKLLWENLDVSRTQCTASVKDGLLYIADMAGNLHCIDAETGKHVWKEELGGKIILRSQMVADGKIYVAIGRTMYVYKEGRTKQKISESKLKSDPSTIEAADGLIIINTPRGVFAYKGPAYTETSAATNKPVE